MRLRRNVVQSEGLDWRGVKYAVVLTDRGGDPRGIGSRVCGEARLEREVKMTRNGGKVNMSDVGLQARRRRHVVESAPFRGEATDWLQRFQVCGPYSHRFGYYQRNDNEMLSLVSQKVMAPLPSANKKKQYNIRKVLVCLEKVMVRVRVFRVGTF